MIWLSFVRKSMRKKPEDFFLNLISKKIRQKKKQQNYKEYDIKIKKVFSIIKKLLERTNYLKKSRRA